MLLWANQTLLFLYSHCTLIAERLLALKPSRVAMGIKRALGDGVWSLALSCSFTRMKKKMKGGVEK